LGWKRSSLTIYSIILSIMLSGSFTYSSFSTLFFLLHVILPFPPPSTTYHLEKEKFLNYPSLRINQVVSISVRTYTQIYV
jgi:uncharacterized Zn-finger protein